MEGYPITINVISLEPNIKVIKLHHCPIGKVFVDGLEAEKRDSGLFRIFLKSHKVLIYVEYNEYSPKVSDVEIEYLFEKAKYEPNFI